MGLVSAKPTFKAPRIAAQARNNKAQIFPAPVIGLDISSPLTDQDPRSATQLENFIVRRSGVEIRAGYRRHTTNIGGASTPTTIKSLMAYQPPRGSGSSMLARLFAAGSDNNIYDVTNQSNEAAVPTVDQAVPGQSDPGEFSWVNFATSNTNYLCICSGGGGYWTYDDGGGWVDRTAAITGAVGSGIDFDFIMAWKNRLWFIKDASTQAWYLPVGQITGVPVLFDFGPLLTHGGELRAMASWTVDSGEGMDDKLVLCGAAGDVLVYGGSDPTSIATFGLIGRWYVGRPPDGRRFMGKYGGDLGILCENGVEYMSRVLQARGLLDPETQPVTVARRYNEVIGQDIRDTRGQDGWQAIHLASEEIVIVVTPRNANVSGSQYCYATSPGAWSTFLGMPMVCAEVFDGNLFLGTSDGKVGECFMSSTDDLLTNGTAGLNVQGILQTAYVAPADDRIGLKRPLLVMPMLQSSAVPSVQVQANTEWSNASVAASPGYTPALGGTWGTALWGSALWGGGTATYQSWVGASGLGCYISLKMSLVAAPKTIFTSWKLVYESGGIM